MVFKLSHADKEIFYLTFDKIEMAPSVDEGVKFFFCAFIVAKQRFSLLDFRINKNSGELNGDPLTLTIFQLFHVPICSRVLSCCCCLRRLPTCCSDAQSTDFHRGNVGRSRVLRLRELPDAAAQFHVQGLLLLGPDP